VALTAPRTAVDLQPIGDDDIERVARFLHANLNDRVPPEAWARALDARWSGDRPNAGFMLVDGDDVVGAHLAFYSERLIAQRRERFCNLGAWCVLPEFRLHALRLLKALLAQDGYHFTDLSPSGNVVGINARLGFRALDTATVVVPNLPWPSWPGRDLISSDPAVIERTLTGRDLELYRDHAPMTGARHLVLVRGREWCYVVLRKERRKNLPLFASILHVSNPELFRRMARPFARHLLLRHGAAVTLAEDRVVGHRPRLSLRQRSPRQRMFLSPDLEPGQVDYFYSELVCLSW
jgi:hypothetical protein